MRRGNTEKEDRGNRGTSDLGRPGSDTPENLTALDTTFETRSLDHRSDNR